MKNVQNHTSPFSFLFTKITAIGLFILIASTYSFGQKGQALNFTEISDPKISFDQVLIHTGQIVTGSSSYDSFTFKNDGFGKLVIHDVLSKNPDVQLAFPSNPISKNGVGSIDVIFSPQSTGKVEVRVMVFSNAGVIPLTLRATGVYGGYTN